MGIKVKVLGRGTYEIEYRNGMRVSDVFKKLGLLSTEYVAVRNGEVLIEDEKVNDGDELVLYAVVSGG